MIDLTLPAPDQLALLATADAATLAEVIRRINAANGWDVDFQFDQVPTKIALIHSEIVEAHAALTLAESQRELGDVIVRAVDLITLVSSGPGPADLTAFGELSFLRRSTVQGDTSPAGTAEWLLELHAHATDALESWRKAPTTRVARKKIAAHLLLLVLSAHGLIGARGSDTQALLVDIIQANAQRGYRHGGRRA